MPSLANPLWQRAISQLRAVIPERTIENWLVKAVPESIDTDSSPAQVVLRVPSRFCKDYLLSNFRGKIEQAISDLHGTSVELTLRVDPSLSGESSEASTSSSDTPTDRGSLSPNAAPSSPESPATGAESPSSSRTRSRIPSSGPGVEDKAISDSSPVSAPRSTADSRNVTKKSAPFSPAGLPASRRPQREDASSPGGRPETQKAEHESSASGSPARAREKASGASQTTPNTNPFTEAEQSLRSEFTFEQFLEGDSNRLARSASVAVAKNPGGTKYNPLVVYGDVGLGKTHLAQAIANYALEHETASTICYVSSERFTSEFVTAIREDNFNAFSSHYRSVDLLVVDDVQFFGGKEKTQEEFFHLFNDLHQHGKQIVLCADRPPSKISGIEDRLLSRFQWGLTADIQKPDLEMRMAVLQLKAETLGLDLSNDVLELIAQSITQNIRQLEGALKQLVAHAQLVQGTVDSSTAETILKREYDVGAEHRQVKAEEIIEGVATYFSLSTDELVSRTRRQKISNARQKAMYLTREMTNLSYASIGLRFGGRDHSTVIHACDKVKDQLEVRPELEEELKSIRSEVRSVVSPE